MFQLRPLTEIWQLTHDKLLFKAERRKFEKKRTTITFKENDLVLVRTHYLSSAENVKIKKFFVLFEGPYKIKVQVAPNSYLLKKENDEVLIMSLI